MTGKRACAAAARPRRAEAMRDGNRKRIDGEEFIFTRNDIAKARPTQDTSGAGPPAITEDLRFLLQVAVRFLRSRDFGKDREDSESRKRGAAHLAGEKMSRGKNGSGTKV